MPKAKVRFTIEVEFRYEDDYINDELVFSSEDAIVIMQDELAGKCVHHPHDIIEENDHYEVVNVEVVETDYDV